MGYLSTDEPIPSDMLLPAPAPYIRVVCRVKRAVIFLGGAVRLLIGRPRPTARGQRLSADGRQTTASAPRPSRSSGGRRWRWGADSAPAGDDVSARRSRRLSAGVCGRSLVPVARLGGQKPGSGAVWAQWSCAQRSAAASGTAGLLLQQTEL